MTEYPAAAKYAKCCQLYNESIGNWDDRTMLASAKIECLRKMRLEWTNAKEKMWRDWLDVSLLFPYDKDASTTMSAREGAVYIEYAQECYVQECSAEVTLLKAQQELAQLFKDLVIAKYECDKAELAQLYKDVGTAKHEYLKAYTKFKNLDELYHLNMVRIVAEHKRWWEMGLSPAWVFTPEDK